MDQASWPMQCKCLLILNNNALEECPFHTEIGCSSHVLGSGVDKSLLHDHIGYDSPKLRVSVCILFSV